MSDFSDSDIIQEELLFLVLFNFGMMSKEDKLEHIDILTDF